MSDLQAFEFTQGETFQLPLYFFDEAGSPQAPLDLSSRTFKSSVRKEYGTEVVVDFTIIETDLANGQVTLELSSSQTEGLPMNTKGRITSFVFDVDMYQAGSPVVVETPLSGYLKVARRVTANV